MSFCDIHGWLEVVPEADLKLRPSHVVTKNRMIEGTTVQSSAGGQVCHAHSTRPSNMFICS